MVNPPGEPRAAGRREAHKQATRTALEQAAARLFADRGYRGTTVQEIAAAAGVTERTFFRYFAGKDELIVGQVLSGLPVLQEAVVARPVSEPPLTAVLNVLREVLVGAERDRDRPSVLGLFDDGPPGPRLARTGANLLLRLEATLAEALQRRLDTSSGSAAPDLHCEVVAAVAVAVCRRALIRRAVEAASGGSVTPRTIEELLDDAIAALSG